MGTPLELLTKEKSGCNECDDFWFSYPRKQPYPLISNSQSKCTAYLCKNCGTFWLEEQRFAKIVNRSEVAKHFPAFDTEEAVVND